MGLLGRTPGERLYRDWCESTTNDRSQGFGRMNPAEKRHWERLAERQAGAVSDAASLGAEVERLRSALRSVANVGDRAAVQVAECALNQPGGQ